jgi:hypothetical protein
MRKLDRSDRGVRTGVGTFATALYVLLISSVRFLAASGFLCSGRMLSVTLDVGWCP